DGLLPAQFRVSVGPVVSHVAPGQVLTMVGTPKPNGLVTIGQVASFYWWEWLLAVVVVLLPMLGYLAAYLWGRFRPPRLRLAPPPAAPHPAWGAPPPRPPPPGPP